jgi:hypothetical protein
MATAAIATFVVPAAIALTTFEPRCLRSNDLLPRYRNGHHDDGARIQIHQSMAIAFCAVWVAEEVNVTFFVDQRANELPRQCFSETRGQLML